MSQDNTGILASDGTIVPGAVVPEISPEDLLLLYRAMILNRKIDERMTRLQRQGRIGFFVGSTGEEAAILGSAFALAGKRAGIDALVGVALEIRSVLRRLYGSLHRGRTADSALCSGILPRLRGDEYRPRLYL